MANQIPLIVNAGAAQIQQLALGDALSVAGNVITGNILAGGYFYANGTPFTTSAVGNVANLINGTRTLSLQSDGTLLPANSGTPTSFATNSATADIDLRNNANTGSFTTGAASYNIRVNGTSNWVFSNTGNLTLPGNALQINYANNTPVPFVTSVVSEAQFIIMTNSFASTAGNRYGVNTVSGPVTAFLPLSGSVTNPNSGDAVLFADAGGAFSTNTFTIDPGFKTIMGGAGPLTVTTNGQSVGLFWNGSTWRIYNAG